MKLHNLVMNQTHWVELYGDDGKFLAVLVDADHGEEVNSGTGDTIEQALAALAKEVEPWQYDRDYQAKYAHAAGYPD